MLRGKNHTQEKTFFKEKILSVEKPTSLQQQQSNDATTT